MEGEKREDQNEGEIDECQEIEEESRRQTRMGYHSERGTG
jgi:hypothetical protein